MKDMDFFEIADLNYSVSFLSWRKDQCPCIVTTSCMWIRGELKRPSSQEAVKIDRLLQGSELLAFMGYDHKLQSEFLHNSSQKEHVSLAGNMFDRNSIMAVMLAAYTCLPLSQFYQAKQSSYAQPEAEESLSVNVEESSSVNAEESEAELQSEDEEAESAEFSAEDLAADIVFD